MKKKITFILMFWLLVACGAPAAIEGGAGAPPDDPNPTSAPAMPAATRANPNNMQTAQTSTPLAAPPPESTPQAFAPAESFSPILYRTHADRYNSYQLLGGVQNGSWLSDEETLLLLEYERLIDVYEYPTGWVGNTTIHNVIDLDPPFCGMYFIGSDLLETSGWQFAFYQGWQVTLHPWTELPTSEIYTQTVHDWLTMQGLAQPQIQISRILKVDIEGDGVDEVFIEASYFKTPNPQSPQAEYGDYSIILMRKVSGNSVSVIPIIADLYHNIKPNALFPHTYFLNSFIDLNQDGNLEVVLDITRWEGSGMMVYEVKEWRVTQVISEVCAE
ncbi:MAG: hypothetical protein KDD74_08350 [Anaerolineales bacterium]|nr:hypothetical protein [Anaerolineales bacterium]